MLTFQNGDVYDGEFHRNAQHGKGRMQYKVRWRAFGKTPCACKVARLSQHPRPARVRLPSPTSIILILYGNHADSINYENLGQ